MSTEAVARRYARALFELAKDAGKVSEVTQQMRGYAEAYEVSSDFRDLEHTPGLRDEERAAVVGEIGKRAGASDMAVRTVTMLAHRQRMAALPDLVRQLEDLADDHLGVVRAHVRSAKPLAEDYRSRLKQKIEAATGKKVLLSCEEDASLIAGIVTQIGDRVVDGSVRGKLTQLADSLKQT